MTLYRLARALFKSWRDSNPGTPVRLLGMGVSGLEHRFGSVFLLESGEQADSSDQQKLDRVLDSINQRYGNEKIVHGQTLRRRKDPEKS
jgi:hypothetical protein